MKHQETCNPACAVRLTTQLELYPAEPVTGMATVVSNRQNLHHTRKLAVDEPEMENLETDAANVWRMNDASPKRHFAGESNRSLELCVVTPTQTRLLVLVVGNLVLMLMSRIWV